MRRRPASVALAVLLGGITTFSGSQERNHDEGMDVAENRFIDIELTPTGGWKEGATFKVRPRFRLPRHDVAPWVAQAHDGQDAVRAIDVILPRHEVPRALDEHLPSGMDDMRMRLSLAADGWVDRIRASFDTYRADVVPVFDPELGLFVSRQEGAPGRRYGKTVYHSDPENAPEFIQITCTRGDEPSADVCEFSLLASDNAVATVYLDESALAHWKEVLSSIRSIVAHWIVK